MKIKQIELVFEKQPSLMQPKPFVRKNTLLTFQGKSV